MLHFAQNDMFRVLTFSILITQRRIVCEPQHPLRVKVSAMVPVGGIFTGIKVVLTEYGIYRGSMSQDNIINSRAMISDAIESLKPLLAAITTDLQ
jgi:hypothetical protein